MDYGWLFGGHLTSLVAEIYLRLSVSGLLVWASVVGTRASYAYPVLREPRSWLTRQVLVITARLVLGQSTEATGAASLRSGVLVQDPLALGRKGFLFFTAVLAWLARANPRLRGGLDAFEYPVLLLLSLLGRLLLISASDLRRLYLGLELQSLCLYVLAAFNRGSAYSTEAGLKFFILGALSSGVLLFGASLLYGSLGTTSYEDLNRLLVGGLEGECRESVKPFVVGGVGLVLSGRLFKLAVVPFHGWAPDVYEGSPRSSSLFFATVTKVASIGAVIRLVLGPFYGLVEYLRPVLFIISLSSRTLAALAALGQRKAKRFLAYSAIGHAGYRRIGLVSGTLEGLQGRLIYRLVYLVRGVSVWSSLGSLSWSENPNKRGAGISDVSRVLAGSYSSGQPRVYRTDLQGLSKYNPALARAVATGRLSRAGIPPRAGFFAKFTVFGAAREASLYRLALVGVLTSVVGAYYYLRWVKLRYFSEDTTVRQLIPVTPWNAYVVAFTWFLLVFGARCPEGILVWTHRMSLARA